jgi:UDPglucose--hexose-1-phosphate uridylyltransferase
VLLFQNHGEAAGATLAHPHLQIVALPRAAPEIEAEREGLRRSREKEPACGYCRLLEDEQARGDRIVTDTGSFLTVTPFASRVPFETWILPRDHAASILAAPDSLITELADRLHDGLGRLREVLGSLAYNWILHTAPVGAGEEEFHWHLEILPRTVHQAGFEWGAGIHLNPMPPEVAARRLAGAGEGR